MAEQNFANHAKFFPPFHFFVLPVLVLGLILSLIHFFAHITHGDMRDHIHSFLLILLAVALLTLASKARSYALKVQDRVIRLEERLRREQRGRFDRAAPQLAPVPANRQAMGRAGRGLETFYPIRVRFPNASGLAKGADVLISELTNPVNDFKA